MKTKIWYLGLMMTIACQGQDEPGSSLNVTPEFSDYWFQGKAELTSFKLEQARYGEVHPGKAVLIFVTEDFSRDKQVKLDNPQTAGNDLVKILKLNATRKFNTGIYPYSMMTSVFTPLNYKPNSTFKITTSSQEWCGHTFGQLNHRGSRYDLSLKSYFESEGDREISMDEVLLEDELWTNIRLDPNRLPIGEIEILPSLFYLRFSHRQARPEKAIGTLDEQDSISHYHLAYQEFERTLRITFNNYFPYKILSWEENYLSGFGDRSQKLKTTAVRDQSIMLDYWNRNSLADSVWRNELNLK